MNRKSAQFLALAALSTFSAASMAFAPRAAVETKPSMPAPSVRVETKAPTATEIKVGNTLNLKSDIVVGETKKAKAGACDVKMFDGAAQGTSVSADVYQELQTKGVLNVEASDCGTSFNEMSPDAREVAALTGLCEVSKGIQGVAGLSERAAIGGECMAGVKNSKGMKVTAASETKSWMAVHNKCAFLQ